MVIRDLAGVVLGREIVKVFHYDRTARLYGNPCVEIYVGSFEEMPMALWDVDIRMIFAYRSKLNIEI